jgi:hypothetical protein
MPVSSFQPVLALHKTKRFWIFVAFGTLPIVGTLLVLRTLGAPPLPLQMLVTISAATLASWAVMLWFIFRFGGTALLTIGGIMIALGILARLHSS